MSPMGQEKEGTVMFGWKEILHVQIIYEGYEEMPRTSYAQDVSSDREHYSERPAFQRIMQLIWRILDFLCLCECMGQ